MKKAIYEQRGAKPQDVIQVVEFEKPVLESGQVWVEVLAAPINPSDLLTLTGQYGIFQGNPQRRRECQSAGGRAEAAQ